MFAWTYLDQIGAGGRPLASLPRSRAAEEWIGTSWPDCSRTASRRSCCTTRSAGGSVYRMGLGAE